MNIASGCPRFVSHEDLKSGGFIVDDTVFIKCVVDTTTIVIPREMLILFRLCLFVVIPDLIVREVLYTYLPTSMH